MKLGEIDVMTLGLEFHAASERMLKIVEEKRRLGRPDASLDHARITAMVLVGVGNVFKTLARAEQAEKKGTRGIEL